MVSVPISYGVKRNFQIFDPLDFLAELTQHIPNKGEHLIRYYGHYSNKARGMRARQAREAGSPMDNPAPQPPDPSPSKGEDGPSGPGEGAPDRLARRRWAMLIQRVYHADPLRCPQCGGTMKIIAFIEAHQQAVIRKILQHCGLPPEDPKGWQDPPSRGPPQPAHSSAGPKSGHQGSLFAGDDDLASRLTHEVDPDFLEFARREEIEEPDPTWEP
jgi:hypothetical protein